MSPDQLKDWRRKNKFSQRKLSTALIVDVMTISRWERGVREIPSFLHLALECLEKKGGKEKERRNETEKEVKMKWE